MGLGEGLDNSAADRNSVTFSVDLFLSTAPSTPIIKTLQPSKNYHD